VKAVAVVAVLAVAGCATAPDSHMGALGQWGGRHVGLTVTEAGGTLDYDCAAGTIDQPLVPARNGHFVARGTHTPDWGGPARSGETLPAYAASYSGSIVGDRMVLRVKVATGVEIGPLTLRRGAEPTIFRCL
jgi:hypothetical protein